MVGCDKGIYGKSADLLGEKKSHGLAHRLFADGIISGPGLELVKFLLCKIEIGTCLNSQLPTPNRCQHVDTLRRFKTSAALKDNRYRVMIGPMIEKYLHKEGEGLDMVHTANSMVRLPVDRTVNNVPGYETFVRCMCYIL